MSGAPTKAHVFLPGQADTTGPVQVLTTDADGTAVTRAGLVFPTEKARDHAEHDRETLAEIENMFEAVGGDLLDEVRCAFEASTEADRLRTELHDYKDADDKVLAANPKERDNGND